MRWVPRLRGCSIPAEKRCARIQVTAHGARACRVSGTNGGDYGACSSPLFTWLRAQVAAMSGPFFPCFRQELGFPLLQVTVIAVWQSIDCAVAADRRVARQCRPPCPQVSSNRAPAWIRAFRGSAASSHFDEFACRRLPAGRARCPASAPLEANHHIPTLRHSITPTSSAIRLPARRCGTRPFCAQVALGGSLDPTEFAA